MQVFETGFGDVWQKLLVDVVGKEWGEWGKATAEGENDLEGRAVLPMSSPSATREARASLFKTMVYIAK